MLSPVVGNRLPGQTPPPAQNTSISYNSFIKNCQNIFARALRTIRRDGFCFDGTRRNRFSGAGVLPEFVVFLSRAKLPPGRRRYLTALYRDACGHNSDHSNRGDLSGLAYSSRFSAETWDGATLVPIVKIHTPLCKDCTPTAGWPCIWRSRKPGHHPICIVNCRSYRVARFRFQEKLLTPSRRS